MKTHDTVSNDDSELAKLHTGEAIGAIVEVMRSPHSPPQDRLRAAGMLLERAHGRPAQSAPQGVRRDRPIAARLAAMSDDALLAVLHDARARRARLTGGGSHPPRGGPDAGHEREGSLSPSAGHLAQLDNSRDDPSADGTEPWE